MTSSRFLCRPLSTFISAAALLTCWTASESAHASSPFTLFESGQVRPLALSPNGKLLFAVNTPDNRLEIYGVKKSGLTRLGSVPVGLEPVLGVAGAARNHRLSPNEGAVRSWGDGLEAGALAARAASAAAAVPSFGVSTARTRPPGLVAVGVAPPVTLNTSVLLS